MNPSPLVSSGLSKGSRNRLNKARRKAAGQALSGVALQQVRALINVAQEDKFFDSKEYQQTAQTTPVQLALSAIPQGSTDSTRDGDQVNLKSLWIKFHTYIQGIGGTNDFTDLVRLIVIRWHPMSTSTSPVPGNYLQDLSVAQSPTMSPFTWDNRKDYTVLIDETFSLSGNGPSDVNFVKKISWRVPGLPAHFTAGSTTLQSEGLFAFVASDSLVATHPLFDLYSRVVYCDS